MRLMVHCIGLRLGQGQCGDGLPHRAEHKRVVAVMGSAGEYWLDHLVSANPESRALSTLPAVMLAFMLCMKGLRLNNHTQCGRIFENKEALQSR
jgi:hypothetical protein